MSQELVTFPDVAGIDDPFGVKTKTTSGETVRPAVVLTLMNREMQRKVGRMLRRKAKQQGLPEPIIARDRLSERETTNRMSDLIIGEWERYHQHFPLATLTQYLDDRTSKIMEDAVRQGKPVDRDAVRRAIGELWRQAEAKRKEKT